MKTKSMFNEIEWRMLWEIGQPAVTVNCRNMRAYIHLNNIDITSLLPRGQIMAETAIKKAGGWVNQSGVYPPTDAIIKSIAKNEAKIKKCVRECETQREIERLNNLSLRFEKFCKEVKNIFDTACFRDYAVAIKDDLLRDKKLKEIFLELASLKMLPLLDQIKYDRGDYDSFDGWLQEITREIEHYPLMPEKVKKLAREVRDRFEGVYSCAIENQGNMRETIKLLDDHPEFGCHYVANGYPNKCINVKTTVIFKQYMAWGLWLSNIENNETPKFYLAPSI